MNYIFSGSDQRLIKWMTEPGAPFFKQLQQIEVGPIDPAHLAAWITKRARTGGLTDVPYSAEIVEKAGPCTGDIVRLAKFVFDVALGGGAKDGTVEKALDAISLVEFNGEFTARWHECSITQRAMLRALAAGRLPTASDTLRAYGVKSGSTAYGALNVLAERYILTKVEKGFVFDSPFFRRWVALNAG